LHYAKYESTCPADIFTHQPPSQCNKALETLVNQVLVLNLQAGVSNFLEAKLDSALAALDDLNENNDISATNSLNAFINFVQEQSSGKISVEDANTLISIA